MEVMNETIGPLILQGNDAPAAGALYVSNQGGRLCVMRGGVETYQAALDLLAGLLKLNDEATNDLELRAGLDDASDDVRALLKAAGR